MKNPLPLIFLLLLFSIATISAQTITFSAISGGGNYYEDDASISWTLGQIAIQTLEKDSTILTQGFHQTDVEVSTMVPAPLSREISLKVYPNPTRSNVVLRAVDLPGGKLRLKLYTMEGTIVKIQEVKSKNLPWELNMEQLHAGIYVLQVFHDGKKQSFKIIKK